MDEVFKIRVTSRELAMWRVVSKSWGISVSELIRQVMRKACSPGGDPDVPQVVIEALEARMTGKALESPKENGVAAVCDTPIPHTVTPEPLWNPAEHLPDEVAMQPEPPDPPKEVESSPRRPAPGICSKCQRLGAIPGCVMCRQMKGEKS
jgi:hypothetical protein